MTHRQLTGRVRPANSYSPKRYTRIAVLSQWRNAREEDRHRRGFHTKRIPATPPVSGIFFLDRGVTGHYFEMEFRT